VQSPRGSEAAAPGIEDAQADDAAEIGDVAGHQRQAVGTGNSGDLRVLDADRSSLSSSLRNDAAVEHRCGLVEDDATSGWGAARPVLQMSSPFGPSCVRGLDPTAAAGRALARIVRAVILPKKYEELLEPADDMPAREKADTSGRPGAENRESLISIRVRHLTQGKCKMTCTVSLGDSIEQEEVLALYRAGDDDGADAEVRGLAPADAHG
jgi:hypothetical protein